MRASASSCICRLAHPQLAVKAPAVRSALLSTAASTSSSSTLLFSSSNSIVVGSSRQSAHASTQAGQENDSDRDVDNTAADVGLEDAPAASSSSSSSKARGLEAWLKSEDGQRYKRPIPGKANWIGRTPFPLNPSFRPPTPLSHNQKEKIYKEFIASLQSQSQKNGNETKSETYHARKVALKYNISLDRVRAVIRLKALEYNTAAAGTELQMKFLNGMESAMGISTGQNDAISMKEALDVQQETEALYKTGTKTHWIMVDEENPADLQVEQEELEKKKLRDQRAMKRREGTDDVKRDVREGVRSRRRVLANPKSERRDVRPEIEFVDVPGRLTPKAPKQARK